MLIGIKSPTLEQTRYSPVPHCCYLEISEPQGVWLYQSHTVLGGRWMTSTAQCCVNSIIGFPVSVGLLHC